MSSFLSIPLSPDKRQRLLLLGSVVLLHVVLYTILCHLTLWTAGPNASEQVAAFQMVKLPPPPPPPVPTPSAAGTGGAPELHLPPVPMPPAVIATTAPTVAFQVPKVDVLGGRTFAALTPGGNGSGQGSGAGHTQGDGTGLEGVCTADRGAFNAAVTGQLLYANTPTMGSMARHHDELLAIFTDPNGLRNWRHPPQAATDPHAPEPDAMDLADALIDPPSYVAALFGDTPENYKLCIVASTFVTECRYPNQLASRIQKLRDLHIKLCIIAFDHPPYPVLVDYVRESGGIIYFPDGIPGHDRQVAAGLNQALTTAQP